MIDFIGPVLIIDGDNEKSNIDNALPIIPAPGYPSLTLNYNTCRVLANLTVNAYTAYDPTEHVFDAMLLTQ